MVEPLESTNHELTTAEWALTDYGRAKARSLTARALDGAKGWFSLLTATVSALIGALVVGFEIDFELKDLPKPLILASLSVMVLLSGLLLYMLAAELRYGVLRGRIARGWGRYQRARLWGAHMWKYRRVAVLAITAGVVIYGLVVGRVIEGFLSVGVLVLFLASFFLAVGAVFWVYALHELTRYEAGDGGRKAWATLDKRLRKLVLNEKKDNPASGG